MKTKAERICDNVPQLDFLQQAQSVLRIFFYEIIEELENIQNELESFKQKDLKRTTFRAVISSPATLAKLKEVSIRLAKIEKISRW